MHTWQRWGLTAYYYTSLPWRQQSLLAWSQAGRSPACVLFYHRVAEAPGNPWTISPREFARQLDWLQAHTDVVSLAEIQQRIAGGTNHRLATHITFDDGYAENMDTAIPLLVERGLRCTYFVSLDYITSGRPFPHDVQAGHPLPPNTLADLRQLADEGFEIGAHTRSHADLGQVDDMQTIFDEVVLSRRELQQFVGRPVPYFAFPYGRRHNLHPAAFRLARAFGMQGVCSAYGDYNWPGGDPFHIKRIHGDAEFARFRNWLTLDPRKVHAIHTETDDRHVPVGLPIAGCS